MVIQELKNGHWGLNDKPVFELVARKRRQLKQSRGLFAKLHGIDRSTQYAFEDGRNRSLKLAIRELEAVGYSVYINVMR